MKVRLTNVKNVLPKQVMRGGVRFFGNKTCTGPRMTTYECALESLRHSWSNDGSHVKIGLIPKILDLFEKKVYAKWSHFAPHEVEISIRNPSSISCEIGFRQNDPKCALESIFKVHDQIKFWSASSHASAEGNSTTLEYVLNDFRLPEPRYGCHVHPKAYKLWQLISPRYSFSPKGPKICFATNFHGAWSI